MVEHTFLRHSHYVHRFQTLVSDPSNVLSRCTLTLPDIQYTVSSNRSHRLSRYTTLQAITISAVRSYLYVYASLKHSSLIRDSRHYSTSFTRWFSVCSRTFYRDFRRLEWRNDPRKSHNRLDRRAWTPGRAVAGRREIRDFRFPAYYRRSSELPAELPTSYAVSSDVSDIVDTDTLLQKRTCYLGYSSPIYLCTEVKVLSVAPCANPAAIYIKGVEVSGPTPYRQTDLTHQHCRKLSE